jgi:hypothetical protein
MNNYQTEFPDFALDVIIPDTWEDISYHNDACPSYHAGLTPEGYNVKVWIDYTDPKEREFPEMNRFCVVIEDNLIIETDTHEGNDWDAVLKFVATHIMDGQDDD